MTVTYIIIVVIETPLPDHWPGLPDWINSRFGAHLLGDVDTVLDRLQSGHNLSNKDDCILAAFMCIYVHR